MLWILIMSLKPNEILQITTTDFWPTNLTLKHYLSLLKGSNTVLWLRNSAIVAGMMTSLTLIISSLAGYAFAKLNFRGAHLYF